MKAAAALLLCALASRAQMPVHVDYGCSREDIESFGLGCTEEDACPVFLEISSVQSSGLRLVVAANLHTATTTLYGLLLMSEDGGKTWTEPQKRLRAATLEQIQFIDIEHGWVSGEVVDPLPKDPFLLITTDGGKTWRQAPLFDESRFGSISQYWFTSPMAGELLFQAGSSRYELYDSMTGGDNWNPKETGTKPIRLSKAPLKNENPWRARADAASKAFKIERGSEVVASFSIHVADCK